MKLSGFLNVRKPAGLTSHQCADAIRRVFGTRQVGHGGTLDPMATGVLTIAVGRATRFLQYLTTGKEYRGVIRLGVTTDTDDITGNILTQIPVPWINKPMVEFILQRFIGEIDQVPPRVSAIKKDGVRLYKLARANKDFDVKPRRVHIKQIAVQNFTQGNFPEIEIDVVCGGGTYIRSIARECGEAFVIPPEQLHSSCNLRNPAGEYYAGGTLVKLERTRSGAFAIADSLSIDEIRDQVELGEFPHEPIERMLQHLPFVELPRQTTQQWLHGRNVTVPTDEVQFAEQNSHKLISSEPIRIYCQSSLQLLGIAQVDAPAQPQNFILRKHLFV